MVFLSASRSFASAGLWSAAHANAGASRAQRAIRMVREMGLFIACLKLGVHVELQDVVAVRRAGNGIRAHPAQEKPDALGERERGVNAVALEVRAGERRTEIGVGEAVHNGIGFHI